MAELQLAQQLTIHGGTMASGANVLVADGTSEQGLSKVILASAVGTMIEWYDFYIFGSLAAFLSPKFYPPGNDTFAYIAYLATFAVGFVVRPFGALFFGRIGDLVGRKYAFLVTLSIMGGATALIGILPTYKTAGWIAPITLLAIRVLQGLALGGEYGGATVYVAEHVPDGKRGFYTSFIQITATLGLFVSLLVILATQNYMTKEAFADWGWRVPFLLSIILVSISLYIRIKMKESPIFSQIKSAGMTSAQPLKDAFGKWENLKRVLISLVGATAGQGVVWYTGQFYALFYLQTVLKVNAKTSNIIVAIALLCAMPFFTLFGSLSDKIGRKWLMMAACLLAVVTYIPIYRSMQVAAGNNVVGLKSAKNKVTGAIALTAQTTDPTTGDMVAAKEAASPNVNKLIFLVFIQVLYVCMIYGPIAAYLVEAFPARIRYTSLSLPYHIGNGVFGGLLPLIGLSLCATTGNIYAGLYYPMIVAGITLVFGSFLLKETHGTRIWDEVAATK
ncbi:MAG TPA: MFS transporter [Candidatus Eremiobacteraceae bacterium]|nr:MFS transporter [Candidatus Eremiobacteraceae bacterium]